MPITSTRLARRVLCARSFEKHRRELVRRLLAVVATVSIAAVSLPAQQAQRTLPVGSPVEAVLITLTRMGPYPDAIKHSTQAFRLWVVDRSDAGEDTFSIVQDATGVPVPSLPSLHSTASKRFDNAVIQLPPGNYRLTLQAHSKWAVKIAVSAK